MYTMSMTVTNMQPFWHKIEHCESKGCPTWRIVEWVSRLWHDTCTSGLENPKSWDFLLAFQLFHCQADHKTWWIKLIQIGFYPRSRGHATFSGRIWASFCCSKHLRWNTSCRTYAGQSSQKCVSKVGSWQHEDKSQKSHKSHFLDMPSVVIRFHHICLVHDPST